MRPLRKQSKAFTLVELIATVAIVAMLAVVLVVFIGGYIADAKRTADRQTLAVLNDALTRYKTQGGSLAALTSGASIGNVLTELQTPVTWAGMRHQFLKSGTTYTAASIGAIGEGQRYRFTKYGSFADGSAVGSDILETVAAAGYDVGDEAVFDEWITQAMAETGTTNYLALTNHANTSIFGLLVRVANSGDKVRVWWGNGTTQDYNSISTSSSTKLAKDYGSAAARTIIIVGDIALITTEYTIEDELKFGGDISTMRSLKSISLLNYFNGSSWVNCEMDVSGDISGLTGLTDISIWGNNTISGDISSMANLSYINAGGYNTLRGDVTDLSALTYLSVHGNNTVGGDVTSLVNLTRLNVWGNNTITGDVSSMNSLSYLNAGGNDTLTGNISSMSNLGYFSAWGNSSFNMANVVSSTGSIAGLSYINIGTQYTLSESQVDTILTNMDSNKDQPKPRSERFIHMDKALHAAPSVVGLTAKTNLQNAGWDVLTK